MSYLWISLGLALVAGFANLFGAAIISAKPWSRPFLAAFVALGAGFMLATAISEMVPESLKLAPVSAPLLILAGYFIVHFFEHSLPPHFHFGEETHTAEFANPRTASIATVGLMVHTFFGGVSLASGYVISSWLGTVIFGSMILHNIPEGFTVASIMVASGKKRPSGMWAAALLGGSRIAGVFAVALAERFARYGLALSAGVVLYCAASDLIPEANKQGGPRVAFMVAAGFGMVVLLKYLFLGRLAP